MNDTGELGREKVEAIFREFVGDRVEQIHSVRGGRDARSAVTSALAENLPDETAADIAFHLTDWASDAAFLTALILFPARFPSEEIRKGVTNFLVHVPNHVIAAAHLDGWAIRDIFEVGVRIQPPHHEDTPQRGRG